MCIRQIGYKLWALKKTFAPKSEKFVINRKMCKQVEISKQKCENSWKIEKYLKSKKFVKKIKNL